MTDAELAEIEGWARAYLVDWPEHPRARFVKQVAAMVAELRCLRGEDCSACAEWGPEVPRSIHRWCQLKDIETGPRYRCERWCKRC